MSGLVVVESKARHRMKDAKRSKVMVGRMAERYPARSARDKEVGLRALSSLRSPMLAKNRDEGSIAPFGAMRLASLANQPQAPLHLAALTAVCVSSILTDKSN